MEEGDGFFGEIVLRPLLLSLIFKGVFRASLFAGKSQRFLPLTCLV